MKIRVGYELQQYECPHPTPMILALHVHYSRVSDMVRPDCMIATPDPVHLSAEQHPVPRLPEETLVFLLGSRCCETDRPTLRGFRIRTDEVREDRRAEA